MEPPATCVVLATSAVHCPGTFFVAREKEYFIASACALALGWLLCL